MTNFKNINKAIITTGLAALMAVSAGCSSNAPQEVGPEEYPTDSMHGDPYEGSMPPVEYPTWKESDGPATWQCTDFESGVKYTFSLPTNTDRDQIRTVESLRKRANITEPVSYLWVDIDATQAFSDPGSANRAYKVIWATTEHESVEATGASERISDWRSQYVDANNTSLYNAFIDGGNSLLNTSPNLGAKGFDLMVTDKPITSMVSPAVLPSGFSSAPCELKAD